MDKVKTSQKRGHSSKKLLALEVRPNVLKKLKTLPKHYAGKKLSDPKFIAEALMQCLIEGDDKAFKEILKSHYEAVNITKALKKAHLSQRTFFEALSPKGNPSLKTVIKIIKGLAA